MSFHTDYDSWIKMADPQHCPVCQAAEMPSQMVDVVELPHSWLVAEPVECLRGACHVIAKRHVVELYELDESELLGLMREVQCYAWALQTVTAAVKINYEIHGNSAPHLHLHLYPRYLDDPFPGRAIDTGHKIDQYAPGAFECFVSQLRAAIAFAPQPFGARPWRPPVSAANAAYQGDANKA
jgi:diadenosine tetraphosphate (Ap4A) HIT family hydrolase